MTRTLSKFLALLIVLAGIGAPQAYAAAPAAPTNVTVSNASLANTATNAAQASVSWTAVTGAIGYYVSATAAGSTTTKPVAGGSTTSYIFEGLTGGTSYSFTVFARNSSGEDSAESTAVIFVAQSIPGAPTAISAVAGVGQVTLTWSAPANTGGLSLGNYKITAAGVSTTAGNGETTKIISGLSAGAEYTFSIQANNSLGDSAAANFSATTVPNTPGAPTSVTAQASGTKVTASWVAPTNNGGSAITGYKAYLINSGNADSANLSTTATTVEFTSVTAGTYTVKVVATNIVGDSARSAASSGATVAPTSSLLANDPVLTPSTFSDLAIDSTVAVSAVAPSGGTVTISVTANPSGSCTYAAGVITSVAVGTCTISASAESNTTYNSGLTTKSFNTVKVVQTITFPSIADQNLPGPLTVAATASSGLTVSFAATGNCSVTGTTISFTSTGNCSVTASQAGNTKFAAATNVSRTFAINSAPSSGGGSTSGGGGGGGAAPKQTALYFQVVDPTDATKIYTKSVCVEIYSRTLIPQFMGTGCSATDGRINVLLADGKVSIRVFELGNGAVYREYQGEVASDVFTVDGGSFFPGTTRWVVTFNKSTPTPVVTPTPTPTPTPVVTPTPTPTPTPVVTPTPTPTPTPVVTPTPTPTPSPSKSSFFSVTTSTKNVTKTTVRSSTTITTKVGRSIQLAIPTVGTKSVTLKLTLKDASGKSYQITSKTISKNKSYTSPIFKMLKKGTLVATFTIGSAKRTVTVKVSS